VSFCCSLLGLLTRAYVDVRLIQNVLMELTLPQFYHFHQQMQNAQKLMG
jgi:hypothetical protein